MTTESVLERLKELCSAVEAVDDLDIGEYSRIAKRYEPPISEIEAEFQDYLVSICPNLIAALELVEAKALQSQRKNSGYWEGYHDGMIAWAREVLAVLNNKDNKEQEK